MVLSRDPAVRSFRMSHGWSTGPRVIAANRYCGFIQMNLPIAAAAKTSGTISEPSDGRLLTLFCCLCSRETSSDKVCGLSAVLQGFLAFNSGQSSEYRERAICESESNIRRSNQNKSVEQASFFSGPKLLLDGVVVKKE